MHFSCDIVLWKQQGVHFYRKNLEEKEALKKEDEEEITDEQLFYSTFVLESDDLWGALYEEEKKIEEFFKMRRHTK